MKNANTNTYNNNLANYNKYQADLADDGVANHSADSTSGVWTATYTGYTAQPAYNATTFSGTASDTLSTTNGPLPQDTAAPVNEDMDSSLTDFLGYLNMDALANRPAGTRFSFTNSFDAAAATNRCQPSGTGCLPDPRH